MSTFFQVIFFKTDDQYVGFEQIMAVVRDHLELHRNGRKSRSHVTSGLLKVVGLVAGSVRVHVPRRRRSIQAPPRFSRRKRRSRQQRRS